MPADRRKVAVHLWPDLNSPSLNTEALKAEFTLSAIKRRGGLVESWDELDGELVTIWLPERGIRVPLLSLRGTATIHSEVAPGKLESGPSCRDRNYGINSRCDRVASMARAVGRKVRLNINCIQGD